MTSTPPIPTTAPLKPSRRGGDGGRVARTIKVQEPDFDDPSIIGTGKDGKEKVGKVLQLSSFEKNFSVENFIGDLTDKLITSSQASTSTLDPLPFTSSLSPALDHLHNLQKAVARKTKQMELEVKDAEQSCEIRLREIDIGFEAVGSSFTALEAKITGVGRTAVRIGEQLESLHQLRSLAQSSSLLLSYYLSLAQPLPPPISTQKKVSVDADGNPIEPAEGEGENPQTPLEILFATRTSREGRTRLAIILRRLSTLAKDVADSAAAALSSAQEDPGPGGSNGNGNGNAAVDEKEQKKKLAKMKADVDKAEEVRAEVEKYAERFEKECLRLFDRSYRKGDVRMMAHCAKVLQDFNGCTSCIQMYVNQHDFFISKDRMLEDGGAANEDGEKAVDVWSNLNEPKQTAPTSEPGLKALFQDIRVTVDQEAQIIQAVFPNKEEVMRVFLQRVFAQVIQQYLETLFAKAAGVGTLALLRMLKLTHSQCSLLIEDLKQYDFSGSGGETTGTATYISTDRRTGATTSVTLGAMLDGQMEEIFSQYLEGGRYLELETKWLVIAYKDLTEKFHKYHEAQSKQKSGGLLDRVVDKLSAPGSTSSPAAQAPSATSAAAAWLQRYGGNAIASATGNKDPIARTASPAQNAPAKPATNGQAGPGATVPGPGEGWSALDGNVKLTIVEALLEIHAEAVGRVVELSVSGEVPKNTASLSKQLADGLGRDYFEVYIDSALVKLSEHEMRSEPDINLLGQIHQVDLALHLWQTYHSTVLVTLISTAPQIRKGAVQVNQNSVTRVENKVNMLMHKLLDVSVGWLSTILKRQRNNDFKPKDEELSFARTTTEPCTMSCGFLEKLVDLVKKDLPGKNGVSVLTEIGVEFHALLLDHFKRFPVNPTGGLMLTKDLAAYQDIIKTFGIPLLNDRFEMLRQLGNSFIVQPDVLKSYLTENHLGRIDTRLLRPYLQQRSDWSSFSKQFGEEEAMTNKTEQVVAGAATAGLLKASRYSMGVGAAGMSKLKDMLKAVDEHAFGDAIPSQGRPAGAPAPGAPNGQQQKPRNTSGGNPNRLSVQQQQQRQFMPIGGMFVH